MSDNHRDRAQTVHVRGHTRSGPSGGRVKVEEHDRSPPAGGDMSGAVNAGRQHGGSDRSYLSPANVAQARKQMQGYLTFFRQNHQRDLAIGRDGGWGLAVRNLEHFLDGTGTPVVITAEQLREMSTWNEAVDEIRLRLFRTFFGHTDNRDLNNKLRSLGNGQSVRIIDPWDAAMRMDKDRLGD